MTQDQLNTYFNILKVKIKRLSPHAILPSYAKTGDAGMDITAINRKFDEENQFFEYGTGIAIEIPEGHVGLLYPRSSISKKDMFLCNAVGVIDSSFRGEIKFRFGITLPEGANPNIYSPGDRIGQLMIIPYPRVNFEEVEELSETQRNTGGFGSSGQ